MDAAESSQVLFTASENDCAILTLLLTFLNPSMGKSQTFISDINYDAALNPKGRW